MAKQFEKLHTKFKTNTVRAANNVCVFWSGPKIAGTYGAFNYFDEHEHKWKRKTAHRMAYMLYVAADLRFASNLDCSHLCHNALCVNTDHLILETHYVNNKRMRCRSANRCLGHGELPKCKLNMVLD